MYGHGHSGNDLSLLNNIFFKEPAIVAAVGASGGFGADGRPAIYSRALKLIEQKKISVESLITHKYPTLTDVEAALASDMQSPDYVKGVVSVC
jgi:threonine dehydrogenase-like Zn-dependent dehydrogenase